MKINLLNQKLTNLNGNRLNLQDKLNKIVNKRLIERNSIGCGGSGDSSVSYNKAVSNYYHLLDKPMIYYQYLFNVAWELKNF